MILSMVGTLSICIAAFSLLVDFGSLMFATGLSRFATAPSATVAAPVAPPPPAPAEYVALHGLPSAKREAVIAGMAKLRPLSDSQKAQLNALLADIGQDIILLSTENITTDRIATYVTSVSETPNSAGGVDEIFTLGSGRVQLSDGYAVFFPANDAAPIRSIDGVYADSTGSHMSALRIAAVVDRAQSLCNHALNAAQVSALAATLESTSQTLITPAASDAQAASQVVSAQALSDSSSDGSTVVVTTQSGAVSLGPTGQSFPGTMMLNAGGPFAAARGPQLSRHVTLMLMLDSILALAAAALLMVAGIFALRNAPASRWMHLVYAVGKIFLATFSCISIYSIARQLAGSNPDPAGVALMWTLIVAAPGAIYPLVLLLAMNTRSVREFLSAPTVARIY
jgi:hypothetical protein